MPEMPEVETMVSRLQRWNGWRIKDVEIDKTMSEKASARFLPGDERDRAIGEAITGIYRRGKFVVILTSSGAILCHNAMSGYWDSTDEPWTFDYVEGQREASENDVRVSFTLEHFEERRTLRYHDARMFGSIHFVDPQRLASKLSELGPEADTTVYMYEPCEVMSHEKFIKMLDSKLPVRQLLTDQKRIAGIGNIYAAEVCWFAKISPFRKGETLSSEERLSLWMSSHVVLRRALARRLDYSQLAIYRRERCSTCEAQVTAEDFKGRTTYWCKTCQK